MTQDNEFYIDVISMPITLPNYLDTPTKKAMERCIVNFREILCMEKECPVEQNHKLHIHCPKCNAPIACPFNNWDNIQHIPTKCEWCNATITYPKFAIDTIVEANAAITLFSKKVKLGQIDPKNPDGKKETPLEKDDYTKRYEDASLYGSIHDGALYSPKYGFVRSEPDRKTW